MRVTTDDANPTIATPPSFLQLDPVSDAPGLIMSSPLGISDLVAGIHLASVILVVFTPNILQYFPTLSSLPLLPPKTAPELFKPVVWLSAVMDHCRLSTQLLQQSSRPITSIRPII